MTRRHILILLALCSVVYATGLTVHGVSNWQEGQRLVVARDMQQRGDWLVPTINGQPYLAKPPMVYWCQLVLARITGREVGLYELRLTVALAGMLGVVCTYFVSRRLLSGVLREAEHTESSAASEGALWSALCLATGVLYVHSSRVGELDILLVPFTVVAIGAAHQAWVHARQSRREHWPAILLATLAATGAVMTKGPPGVLVIAMAGFGGMAVWAAFTGGPVDTRSFRRTDPSDDAPARAVPRGIDVVGGGIGLAAAGTAAAFNASGLADVPGVLLLGICGGVLGLLTARLLLRRERGLGLFTAWSRTHPLIVLGVPMLVFWGWGRLVSARIGADTVSALAAAEAEDNLRLFWPGSPVVNLEAISYGVGLASVVVLVGVAGVAARWLRERRRAQAGRLGHRCLHPEMCIVIAWVGLSLIAFSLLGKGVGRYLTPVWPGVAILAGAMIVQVIRTAPSARAWRVGLACIIAVLALAEAWWYAVGREMRRPERSPAGLVTELLSRPEIAASPDRILTFEFRTPAVDYYAGRWVQHVGETGLRPGIAGGQAWTIDEMVKRIRESGVEWTVLLRREARLVPPNSGERPPIDRLAEAGLVVQTIPMESRFVIDGGKAEVGVARVWVR